MRKLPEEEQEYYAKEVYKNDFSLELLKNVKEGKTIQVPTRRIIMKYITFILSDKVVFPVFEISFFLLFFYAFLKGKGFSKSTFKAIRGEKSRNIYYLTFGIALIILLQVINSADALRKYKTIITISNLFMLVNLLFFNSWVRNKIISFTTNSQKKAE